MESYHIPVLLQESVDALLLDRGGLYVDATFGGGGHSREILKRMGRGSHLIAIDRDAEALANAPQDKRLTLVENNYRFLRNYVEYHGFERVDGILADLGVSSHQFDTESRGFSFRFDSPLDMRMSQQGELTAATIVNNYSDEELIKIFRNWGEIRRAAPLARLICNARKSQRIESTYQLNRVVEPLINPRLQHKELAKIYQALRIEVNGEMDSLALFLESTLELLNEGGRLVIISYHSLEDRLVKNFIRFGNIEGRQERDIYGICPSPFKAITRKPIIPSEEEIEKNSRARSAKLRVAERVMGKC